MIYVIAVIRQSAGIYSKAKNLLIDHSTLKLSFSSPNQISVSSFKRIFAALMGIFATLIGVEKSFQVVRKVGPGQRFKPEVFSSSNI